MLLTLSRKDFISNYLLLILLFFFTNYNILAKLSHYQIGKIIGWIVFFGEITEG